MKAAYAVYFDHKRRTDPEFRKSLKRESRKIAKAAKEEAEAQGQQQKQAIRDAVSEAQEEGFPTNVEDKEAYFMNEVGHGETLCQSGEYARNNFGTVGLCLMQNLPMSKQRYASIRL